MITIHADPVEGAVEQLALLVLEGGTRSPAPTPPPTSR